MATINGALRVAILTEVRDHIDAGGSAGYVEFRKLAKPATPDHPPPASSLLGTLALSYPCGTIDGGTYELIFAAITQDNSADDGGTATWARIYSSDNDAVIDVTVGAIGSGAELQMNNTTVVAGGPLRINSFKVGV